MDKPLGKITLEEVQTWCKENDDCPGCPCYTKENGCIFASCAEAAEWPLNTEQEDPSAAADTNVGHKPAKPRLAEVLGVDVNERFQVNEITLYVDWMGVMRVNDKNGTVSQNAIYTAINHPESIIRAPRLTEAERIFLQGIPGVKWVSRDVNADDGYVDLWGAKPELIEGCYNGPQGIGVIGRISSGLCISVHPGDCIEV